MSATEQIQIRRLGVTEVRAQLDGLAAVLVDCVAGGAAVSYLAPFSHEQGRSAFEVVAAEVEQGRRLLLAAFANGDLVGTGAGDPRLAAEPTAPRRDRKAPRSPLSTQARHCPTSDGARRGRGARVEGKTLLVLDTVTGDNAERLYERLGWTRPA